MINTSKVYIILVNWNGWTDTIECLESIFRNDYPNYCVIVCDNNSSDNSLEYIQAWAEGKLDILVPKSNPFHSLSYPPIEKPVSYVKYGIKEADSGGKPEDIEKKLILVQTGSNLGFGGGNNVGLRYVLSKSSFKYVWLLNNDTAIESNAINKMIETASDSSITGSVLKYYSNPNNIQAYGGGYFSAFTSRVVSETKTFSNKLDFINGASFMLSRDTLEKVGLFDSEIFMYFEENEYCIRAKKHNIQMKCADVNVFHKVGGSKNSDRNYTSWLNLYKNKVYVMKKHFSYGFWLLFFTIALIVNAINIQNTHSKRKAATETLFKLPILLWKSRFI